MTRQKKDYISLHIKADAELMQRFNKYCDEVGQTKTMAFERIIAAFLDNRDSKPTKMLYNDDSKNEV